MIEAKGIHSLKQFIPRILPCVLGVYILFQSLLPNIEPTIFWGEMIVLILFLPSLSLSYQSDYQKKIINCILIWIYFFPFYAFFMTSTLWGDDYVPKYFL